MKLRNLILAAGAFAVTLSAPCQKKYVDPGAVNPFGVLVQHAYDHTQTTLLVDPDQGGVPIEAGQLHASWVRATSTVWRWDSTNPVNGVLDAIVNANAAPGATKEAVVWTLSNGVYPTATWDGLNYIGTDQNGNDYDTGIHHLTMTQYGNTIDDMLNHYVPEIVMIENEELAPNFYTSTAEQYLMQLNIAIGKVHAHLGVDGAPVKITDGAFNAIPCSC